ncbi:hypothetical protein CA13_39280 [Planctomycetes bacterium CA13]|uniref:Uncharacterized protein n=1 Tax=Novipirellula herctigrandis TaxID=2527986 RepID=A0A5C5Z5I4_9BACT|nr:hypothetical protein CA13_39280 [Planctomycetes bacterium CA13]
MPVDRIVTWTVQHIESDKVDSATTVNPIRPSVAFNFVAVAAAPNLVVTAAAKQKIVTKPTNEKVAAASRKWTLICTIVWPIKPVAFYSVIAHPTFNSFATHISKQIISTRATVQEITQQL